MYYSFSQFSGDLRAEFKHNKIRGYAATAVEDWYYKTSAYLLISLRAFSGADAKLTTPKSLS